VALIAAVALLTGAGVLAPIDDALRDARFSLLKRPVSDTLAVVEIDAASLRAFDDWPWPRDRYARVLENLRARGAEVVAFDVDFSAQSNDAAGDAAFAAAIAPNADQVVLPTFVQSSRSAGRAELVETAPRASFAGDAALASVNLVPERDGRLRRGWYGLDLGSGYRPSMASALADGPYGSTRSYEIDFGIDPRGIDRLSFIDVYNNDFDAAFVRGRRILIGATAVELGDEFAVPVYRILPGAVLHALSYESIVQGRALSSAPAWLMFLAACGLIFLRTKKGARGLWRRARSSILLVFLLAAVVPFCVQALWPVTIDVAQILCAEVLCLGYLTLAEMKRRAEEIVRQRETLLQHQATHDSETDLPNRRALAMAIEEKLASGEAGNLLTVAIGIDRLSAIRGAIGYSQSNYLVLQIATRLRDMVSNAAIARLSTSILGIACEVDPDQDAQAWAERLLVELGGFSAVDGASIDLGFRLGVAEFGRVSPDAESLLEHSSVALDAARAKRRDIVVFRNELAHEPMQRLSLMSDLTQAMGNGELSLAYQPKLDLRSGRLSGAEALLRWTHPERGAVSPDLFIAVAEETSRIRAVTTWVLHKVIADAAALRKAGADLPISVNLSAQLLSQEESVAELVALALSSPLPIVFEITETAVIESPQAAFSSIERILQAGLKISIDDYGVGLSALSYLKAIPAQELKLDKSFVQALERNPRDRLLTKSTIDLAHSLGMEVVAEGVESDATRLILYTMGCDHIQGYLLAPALSVAQFATFAGAYRAETDAAPAPTRRVGARVAYDRL
jgi:predicted signal transduction protein with EAL and GGDEF domain